MNGGDNTTTDDICRCGHRQSEHIAQEHPAHELRVAGHGACTKCKCPKFFWVATGGSPEAKEYIRSLAEDRALDRINSIAQAFDL